jgi:AcrR family transcriptional regulator
VTSVTRTGTGQARTPEPRRQRVSAIERRELILDAALGVFAAAGYHEASLDAVAAKAGISKALIYEHFDSKLELHRALLDTYGQEMLEAVTTAAAAADPGEARLRAGVEAFLGYVEERPETWRMVFRHLDDPGVNEWLERMRAQVADTIAALITRDAPLDLGQDSPPIEHVAPMLAQQLIGAVQSLASWWDQHREVTKEQVRDMVMNFAWVGLERLSQGESWDSP